MGPLTFTGWIDVFYGQYYLMSLGASEPEPPDEEGAILSNEADEGSVFIASGTHTGKIRLTVRMHDQEPPLDSSEWDHVEESEIQSDNGEIDIVNWGGGTPDGFSGLAEHGPGRYRVRVHVRGRPGDVAPGDVENDAYEEHLIEMWPESST